MKMSSTIKNKWKFCTFASFISCIILLSILNQGHDSEKLSHVQNITLSTTSSNHSAHQPAASVQILKPSNIGDHEKETNEEEHICNIFDGKWTYDPTASPLYNWSECPFLSDQVSCQRNGRADSEYENWSWEAKGCEIPRFNGTDLLERLRGKRVILAGDSLNRNQWESLACLLYSAIPIPSSQAYINVKSNAYKVLRAKDYNCSVEFYWSPFLTQVKENRGSKIMRLDRLSAAQNWHGAHIMVFNTGHWWEHPLKIKELDFFQYRKKVVEVDKLETELAFEMAMKTWARWIDKNVVMNNTKVFFRSISPEHKGKQWCYNETKPIMDESYEVKFPKSMVEIIERTIGNMRKPVRYLNITKLSQYRRDAHPSVYKSKKGTLLTPGQPGFHADCSHWCLPGLPDTWNRLLFASMALDNSKEISSS
ncbi:protein trichome birefringence-like 42 [Castanea sativa]|uniref:protein trichome birefringence-like 42 n=1 Tax=Castanea sativa TaxID=21020 RepID=UPI003F64D445